jgi:lambda family phage portal protein
MGGKTKAKARTGPAELRRLETQIKIEQARFQLGRMQAFTNLSDSAGYQTPGSSKRSMRGWNVKAKSADADILGKLSAIRGGSRDLAMNTPVAQAALERVVTNAIGWGLTLQANIDREVLGLTDEEAQAWERKVERHWRYWSYSQEADASRALNFQTIQGVALYNMLLSGDCFVLLPYIDRPGSPYRLKLKLLEADYICNPDTKPETTSFAAGIEYDQYSAPTAYHVKKVPPNQPLGMSLKCDWERVDAFGSNTGRRNVIHLMLTKRIGQRRGVPFLAPVIERLKQISRLSEAELAAAVIASYFSVFIKGHAPLKDALSPGEQVVSESEAKEKGMVELAPGMVFELGDDQSGIEIADPKRPNGAFDPFFSAMVKEVGACLGIPFEVMMQHFSSSYSASRAAMLEAWKKFHDFRHFMIEYLNDPVYEAFLDDIISKGIISAPGFSDDWETRQAWLGCRWTGRGQGQINPLVETEAALKRVGGLFTTYEEEVAALSGERWDSVLVQRAREEDLKRQHNMTAQDLAPESFGTQPAQAPAPRNEPKEPGEEDLPDATPKKTEP